MKFLVDESSGRKLFLFLLGKGFDVKFVGDIMSRALDHEVLEVAENDKRILITNDKEFGELIFRLSRPSSGVILLRLRLDSPINRQYNFINLIDNFSDKLGNHFFVLLQRAR